MAQVDNHSGGLSNITSNPSDTNPETIKLPSEVQKAVCTVTAGEVRASAEAVTTKTLKGVCGSDEMNLAFRNLESKLYEELRVMKLILVHLAKASGLKINTAFTTMAPPTAPPLRPMSTAPMPVFKPIDAPPKMNPPKEFKTEENEVNPDPGARKTPMLKDLEANNSDQESRDEEVGKFNNTMLADRDVTLFTYYWKLENVTERLKDPKLTIIRSPGFSIKGKLLQLKCTFHHMNRDLLNLQLEYATSPSVSKSGQSNNIMLDMGGMFQEFQWTEDVKLKHKLSILDQNLGNRNSQDLSSQELTKLGVGFSMPNSVLLGSTYIKQNALLIQILLYL
ncbi:hypothetical protein KR074_000522 [Drosophila pseudoananassae]|nr:hypothetical protein KR074_000522 [Drosophila pseudoananassae]